jgi:hypothetical protein
MSPGVGMTKKFGWAGECGGAGDQRRIKKRATIHEGKRRLGKHLKPTDHSPSRQAFFAHVVK